MAEGVFPAINGRRGRVLTETVDSETADIYNWPPVRRQLRLYDCLENTFHLYEEL